MTPVLDFLNHKAGKQGGGRLDCDANGDVVFSVGADTAAGQELFLDYQVGRVHDAGRLAHLGCETA